MLQAGTNTRNGRLGTEPESERGLLHTEKDGKIIREYVSSSRGNYGDYYDGIYNAIRNNEDLPVSAEDGLKVVRLIELAYGSSEKKKIIPFA
jgi:predicted dehydrogenase